MKWHRNVNEIPPKTEVLVLTDLGECSETSPALS